MTTPTDTKILAAVITARSSIIDMALTYLTKRFTELADKRIHDRMHLMAFRNEFAGIRGLYSAREKNTRNFGFKASLPSVMARIIVYD
jgi:hypothetical protein